MQCLPALGGAVGIVNAAYILFTLSSSYGYHFNKLSPQGVVIALCVMGIVGTPITLCFLPGVLKNAKLAAPIIRPVKRLNLLGLVMILTMMPLLHCRALRAQHLSRVRLSSASDFAKT